MYEQKRPGLIVPICSLTVLLPGRPVVPSLWATTEQTSSCCAKPLYVTPHTNTWKQDGKCGNWNDIKASELQFPQSQWRSWCFHLIGCLYDANAPMMAFQSNADTLFPSWSNLVQAGQPVRILVRRWKVGIMCHWDYVVSNSWPHFSPFFYPCLLQSQFNNHTIYKLITLTAIWGVVNRAVYVWGRRRVSARQAADEAG